jgi:hypothetical protein
MNKPQFKLLPCIFCTIGFNAYVAGHKIVCSTLDKFGANKELSSASKEGSGELTTTDFHHAKVDFKDH